MIAGLLADLRHGRRPAVPALEAFATGLSDGRVSDAQAGAFAMAVCLRGLGAEGRAALTRAMADSGDRLRWDLPGPVADKHSTGGIGDCVSLVLAPMLAACGAFVPMVSGRGLGHTGGTLDKLEAIDGLRVELDENAFRSVVREAGCAIVAATRRIAPADRRLYAIRDESGTVDHTDLIVPSILSKKLAAGPDALVFDVKAGAGAFMADLPAARELARALVDTSRAAGCPASALVTDMDAPVAPAIGNALEVAAATRTLRDGTGRLADLSVALGADLLALARIEGGAERLREALASGAAAERFARMVAAQGGPEDVMRWTPTRAPVVRDIAAPGAGIVAGYDGRALGEAVIDLGGGRRRAGDRIDPAVGFDAVVPAGRRIEAGAPIARVHARDEAAAAKAAETFLTATRLAETPQNARDIVLDRLPT